MKKAKTKQASNPAKKTGRRDRTAPPCTKASRVYGELGNGSIFLLTPQWLSEWEKPDKKLKKPKQKTEE